MSYHLNNVQHLLFLLNVSRLLTFELPNTNTKFEPFYINSKHNLLYEVFIIHTYHVEMTRSLVF
jgi:hypothetical protein